MKDLDTLCLEKENELLEWVQGHRSSTNIMASIESDASLRYVRVEQADAASIERLTNSLRALYVIRDGRPS